MNRIVLFFVLFFILGCHSHSHDVSPELKKAFAIQQEALTIHDEVATLLKTKPETVSFEKRIQSWFENMVEIEGMEHDHENCTHNHSAPTILVSDKEMILVQQEWKDSIVVIKQQISSL